VLRRRGSLDEFGAVRLFRESRSNVKGTRSYVWVLRLDWSEGVRARRDKPPTFDVSGEETDRWHRAEMLARAESLAKKTGLPLRAESADR
jgi:hypothetical protein